MNEKFWFPALIWRIWNSIVIVTIGWKSWSSIAIELISFWTMIAQLAPPGDQGKDKNGRNGGGEDISENWSSFNQIPWDKNIILPSWLILSHVELWEMYSNANWFWHLCRFLLGTCFQYHMCPSSFPITWNIMSASWSFKINILFYSSVKSCCGDKTVIIS